MDAFRKILLLSLWFNAWVVQAGDDWELVTDKNRVKVYQQQQPGLPFKHTKGVITIQAKAAMVFALLNDFAVCDQWVYGCLEGQRQADDSIYLVFKGPPFFNNREVVLKSQVNFLDATGQWLIAVENVPNQNINPDHVEVKSMRAEWLLTPRSDQEITIEHSFYIDPNVSVKVGANRYNSRAIYRTLKQMRKMLQKPKYQAEQELPDFLKQLQNQ